MKMNMTKELSLLDKLLVKKKKCIEAGYISTYTNDKNITPTTALSQKFSSVF